MCRWAPWNGRIRGMKLHLVYDPQADCPRGVEITPATVNDIEVGREVPIEAGATYVFDKGYCRFDWWTKIDAAGACFVTRAKSNTRWRMKAKRCPAKSRGDGFTVITNGTTRPGELRFETDEVIVATGFQTPLRDLPALGVATMADGRIPAQTPLWESVSVPGIFFAGNVTQGSSGLQKQGLASNSSSVNGLRYNARVLARHLAGTLGYGRPRPTLEPGAVIPLLLHELARAPELWIQKGYLARLVTFAADGIRDDGILPLEHVVDVGEDSVAAAVEMASDGTIYPALYVRRGRKLSEHQLEPHPTYAFDSARHREQVEALVRPLLEP